MSSLRLQLNCRFTATALATLILLTATARATFPPWLQHVVGASSIEAALYRVMTLPAVEALYPRPPKESQTELAHLIPATPADAELYTLRARADESALDFAAAESDWKLYTAHAKDTIAAKVEFADFYHRQLKIPQEVATLREVAAVPQPTLAALENPVTQRSWLTFERLFALIADQGLPPFETQATYEAFLARYPSQPVIYTRFFYFLLDQKQYPAAEALIPRFHAAFPGDEAFPVRAQALLEYRRGNIDQALAFYDRAFQPLWPSDLVQSYFTLLNQTHRQRAFVADARARLNAHPDGPEALNALARIFYSQQQQGHLDAAQQAIDAFRIAREQRNAAWSPMDLYTLATLTASTHSYAEAARYDYALASSSGALAGTSGNAEPAAQSGLAALTGLLLTAPDQPIALGSGNLTLYRDIATLDQGPGYWNGILSLWLDGTSPQTEYNAETAKSQSYFHRSKAAALLAQLDEKFPAAPERSALHVQLIRVYAQYGETAQVLAAGKQFLAAFPASSVTSAQRIEVANLMADAYSVNHDTAGEFALYEFMLAELEAQLKASGNTLPLSSSRIAAAAAPELPPDVPPRTSSDTDALNPQSPEPSAPKLDLGTYTPVVPSVPAANAYATLLDRYIGRLVAEGQAVRALTVLRHQLDLNPNDPLLYERLGAFLEQNNLSGEQEAVFKSALARFQDATWYDKLARFYLRERNREAYAALTRQVTDIFSGTDLDEWFAHVGTLAQFNGTELNQRSIGPQLALQLNLYAEKRFPHDLVFIRNLLAAYQSIPTRNPAAYEALLRRHWWEDEGLRAEFFDYLSRTHKLQPEIVQLENINKTPGGATNLNPAAARELAEADIWTSHFEAAAPLIGAVADLYPADPAVGDRAVSIFRSLSYLDPTPASLTHAVAIETRLSAVDPADANRLATLGDLYAEATATGGEDIRSAAPYWRRISTLRPGSPAGALTAATIFWDYFQFNEASAQIAAARARFHQPTLYGYEAGAIAENQRDLPAAIREYTAAVTRPPADDYFYDSLNAALRAYFKPPSDTADSNLQSTAQSLFNSTEARARLLHLAARPATATLVEQSTAQAVAASPTPVALTLRADVLIAQHHQAQLAPLLEQALARATNADEAAAIGNLACSHSAETVADLSRLREVDVPLIANPQVNRKYTPAPFYSLNEVYEHSLSRQIVLTTDPVEKIQLNYALAASLEARKDIPAATRIIDAVYHANPRILGVVRATTDFYARTNQPRPAIATLLEAANAATPSLSRNFTLEAAQKANEANDTAQARGLALALLPATPYDAQVLGIISASYARANDDAGLKVFYEAQLSTVRTATLTPDERKEDTALLRRGLIPALTRLKDYEGALNQYIALLSAYPEDSPTAQEAALYALRHERKPQLVDFLRTTVQQSPKDSRFAILLAQVDTTFEDLPGALLAYNSAIAVRKDRADLYQARVDLELRLGLNNPAQLEIAAADFNRLYLLTYKDPAWMVRLAELRVRQRRSADAVKALQTAYITSRPSAENDFKVASQLADWNLLPEARIFADQGVTLAGPDLLVPRNLSADGPYSAGISGPALIARILTRLGKPDEALATLAAARRAVDANTTYPADLAQQLEDAGISANDRAGQRAAFLKQRQQAADTQLMQAVTAIGATVQQYFTPEQKLAYAQTLDTLHKSNDTLALTAAASAGLADREAEWRKQLLLTGPVRSAESQRNAYAALQQSRLAFSDLASTLEAYATRIYTPRVVGSALNILEAAANAWRDAGNETEELRLRRTLLLRNDANMRDRFFDLLLRHDPAALAALASSNNGALADAAVNYTIAHNDQAASLAAVAARGRTLPPVWRPASASLVLTYFANAKSSIPTADFTQSLASDDTIAARLATPADPAKQLTGDVFFYYASRYGIFLSTVAKAPALPDPEDYLAAELERTPTSTTGYLHLAQTYNEAGNLPAAIGELSHALELAPAQSDTPVSIHNTYAVMLYPEHATPSAAQREQAIAQWRASLLILRHMQERNNFPETFFTGVKTTLHQLGQRGLLAPFQSDVEAIIAPYLARNGNYRSNELLQAVYQASATPAQGTVLILSLAGSGNDPSLILEDLRRAIWIAPESREAILLRQIELQRNQPSGSPGSAPAGLRGYQSDLLALYLDRKDLAKAQALFGSMLTPPGASSPDDMYRIILATRTGHLAPLLAAWRAQPNSAPDQTAFNSAIYRLEKSTLAYMPDTAAIRQLKEFNFELRQLIDALVPTDFLSLAQSRLATGDLAGAVELMHRLSLQPTSTYENGALTTEAEGLRPGLYIGYGGSDASQRNYYANTDYAAALLEAAHRPAEAIPFLTALVQSVPWDVAYKLRLAQAQLASNRKDVAQKLFTEIAADASAPYGTRIAAAEALSPLAPASIQFGSAELALLASPRPAPAAARQPYFNEVRIFAASSEAVAKADRIALLRESIAITPSGRSADRARLALLQLEADTGNPSAVIALLGAVQRAPVEAAPPSANAADSDEAAADPANAGASSDTADTEASAEDDVPIMTVFLPAIATPLDLPVRIHLATQLSNVYLRDNQPEFALTYAQLAITLSQPEPDPSLIRQRDALNAAVALERRNALRRPTLQPALAQPTQVRPRLTLANLIPAEAK